jgi:hypothetical protein
MNAAQSVFAERGSRQRVMTERAITTLDLVDADDLTQVRASVARMAVPTPHLW